LLQIRFLYKKVYEMNIAKRHWRVFCQVQIFVVMVLAALALPAQGEEAAPSGGLTPAQLQELQQLQQEMQTLGQQLDAIQQAALQANPELQNQQEQYRKKLTNAMQEQGADPEPVLERMGDIQEQLQDEELDKEKRQQLINTYREKDMRLQRARQEAMQNEEVRKAAEDLSEATLTAMREQDPKTEELLQELEQLQQRMQKLISEARAEGQ
jgi:hypothetical protein